MAGVFPKLLHTHATMSISMRYTRLNFSSHCSHTSQVPFTQTHMLYLLTLSDLDRQLGPTYWFRFTQPSLASLYNFRSKLAQLMTHCQPLLSRFSNLIGLILLAHCWPNYLTTMPMLSLCCYPPPQGHCAAGLIVGHPPSQFTTGNCLAHRLPPLAQIVDYCLAQLTS